MPKITHNLTGALRFWELFQRHSRGWIAVQLGIASHGPSHPRVPIVKNPRQRIQKLGIKGSPLKPPDFRSPSLFGIAPIDTNSGIIALALRRYQD